jgi:hypothetical protein
MSDRQPLSPRVQQLIDLSNRVGARLAIQQKIIDQRGGLPDKPRTSAQWVLELKWRLAHFVAVGFLLWWSRQGHPRRAAAKSEQRRGEPAHGKRLSRQSRLWYYQLLI